MGHLVRYRNLIFLVFMSIFATGCGANLSIIDLGSKTHTSELTISKEAPVLLINQANVTNKALSGTCPADSKLDISLNATFIETVACSNGQWSWTYNYSAIPDSNAVAFEIKTQEQTTTESKKATASLLKDTVAPILTSLQDITIPTLSHTIPWDCTDPTELCRFRSYESNSPAFVFIGEIFSDSKSAALSTQGVRYLYVQAIDKAQNLSTPVQIKVYTGTPQIYIGGLNGQITSGHEELTIIAPNSLPEMALFNNQTCSGTANWESTKSSVANWALDPAATGGTAYVSVKFRNAALEESACYHDSVSWPIFTNHTMCSDIASNAATGILVDSGGASAPYSDDEYCEFELTVTTPTTLYFDQIDTEEDYDYLGIEVGNDFFEYTGQKSPGPIQIEPSTVYVYFSSDSSNTGPGFKLKWAPTSGSGAMGININQGAKGTSSAHLNVSITPPTHMSQVYLTEDSTCSTGGQWQDITSTLPWTLTSDPMATPPITSENKTLYAKFRDAFGNEAFCVSDTIYFAEPEIYIDYPGNWDLVANSLEMGGSCSAPGAQVKISGTMSAQTVCDENNEWFYALDTSAQPNGSQVTVIVTLQENGDDLITDQLIYTIGRSVSITSPSSGSSIGPNIDLSGDCNILNGTIKLTGSVNTTTTCDGSGWSLNNVFVSGAHGSTATITAELIHSGVTQNSSTATYTLHTIPPTVIITDAPTTTTLVFVPLKFEGTHVTKIRYKVTNSSSQCSDSFGYVTELDAPATYSMNTSGYPNGTIAICAIGKSSINGLWQSMNNATYVSWIKDSAADVNITTKNIAIVEGTNTTLTFTLTTPKFTDTKVYYNYLGSSIYMVDHNLTPSYVLIPAGSLSASVSYTTFDNALADGDRNLNIFITHTDNPSVLIGTTNTVQHLIMDNDSAMKGIKKVAKISNMACAIYTDDRLFCWGDNSYGQLGMGHTDKLSTLVEPVPGETFIDVTAGNTTVCAITTGNKIKCWGGNDYGQLGNGNTTAQLTPQDINASNDYQKISTDGRTTCALNTAGKLYCWGYNSDGGVGIGNTTNQNLPVKVNDDVFTDIQVNNTVCAIRADKVLYCWGVNYNSQVNPANTNKVLSPIEVDAGTKYLNISPGSTICGVNENNKLRCWGYNYNYATGAGTTNEVKFPTTIDAATNYLSVYQNCAITTSNDLKCWGEVRGIFSNSLETKIYTMPRLVNDGHKYASIGYLSGVTLNNHLIVMGDSQNNSYYPMPLTEMALTSQDTIADFKVGGFGACAIKTNGIAYCVGDLTGNNWAISSPNVVNNGSDFTGGKAASSTNGDCVIDAAGALFCRGTNDFGATGVGHTNENTYNFSQVGAGIAFANTARERYYCGYGISKTGKLYSWGSGGGKGCTSLNPTAMDAAETYLPQTLDVGTHTCAITSDNRLKCLGNDSGIGPVGGTPAATPRHLDSGTFYKKVMAQGSVTCGITTADKLRCWGYNGAGQLGRGTTSNSAVPMTVDAAESYLSVTSNSDALCGITTGKVLKCWGLWGDSQDKVTRTTPTEVNAGVNYESVAFTNNALVALTSDGKIHYWNKARIHRASVELTLPVTMSELQGSFEGGYYCAKDTTNRLWCARPYYAMFDGSAVSTPRHLPMRRK